MSNRKCQRCSSIRVASIFAHCSDSCAIEFGQYTKNRYVDGYVPLDMGISSRDSNSVVFSWCLECGQIQGKFPLPTTKMEKSNEE